MTSSTISSNRAPAGENRFTRYAAFLVSGIVVLWGLLFLFSTTVDLIGTDVIPVDGWKRLSSNSFVLQHQLDKLRSHRYILVFGTSRNNMLSADYLHAPTLNLNFVYGEPGEILSCLRMLDQTQLRNIEKVFVLVDYHTLEKNRFRHPLRLGAWDYLSELIETFSLQKVSKSFETVAINLGAPYAYYLSEDGNLVPGYAKSMAAIVFSDPIRMSFRLDAVDDLKALNAFLIENKVPAVFYLPTLPVELIRALNRDVIERFVRAAVSAVPRLFQLIYVPEVSSNTLLFSDDSHLNAAGYRKLYLETDWNKFLMTPDNIETNIRRIDPAFVPTKLPPGRR